MCQPKRKHEKINENFKSINTCEGGKKQRQRQRQRYVCVDSLFVCLFFHLFTQQQEKCDLHGFMAVVSLSLSLRASSVSHSLILFCNLFPHTLLSSKRLLVWQATNQSVNATAYQQWLTQRLWVAWEKGVWLSLSPALWLSFLNGERFNWSKFYILDFLLRFNVRWENLETMSELQRSRIAQQFLLSKILQ